MFTDCSLKCLLAAGLFSSMLYSTLNQTKNVLVTKFQETLTEEQNAVYKQVVKERMTIYVNGLLLVERGELNTSQLNSKIITNSFHLTANDTTNVNFNRCPKMNGAMVTVKWQTKDLLSI